MKILIERNEHLDITIKSLKNNSVNIEWEIVDQGYLDLFEYKTQHVLVLRGSSIKIFTKKFNHYLNRILMRADRIMLSKKYPGVYLKKGYDKAYYWNRISNPYDYDNDVALINVNYFNSTNVDNRQIDLLPYNLNAKDDAVMSKIAEPYCMLQRNAWITKHAGLINLSEENALSDDIDSAFMFPYDILSSYVGRKKMYQPIKNKAKLITQNFGKLKKLMVKYA